MESGDASSFATIANVWGKTKGFFDRLSIPRAGPPARILRSSGSFAKKACHLESPLHLGPERLTPMLVRSEPPSTIFVPATLAEHTRSKTEFAKNTAFVTGTYLRMAVRAFP